MQYMKKLIFNSFKKFIYFIFPEIVTDYFSYLNKFKSFQISYSQFGEDLILKKYLEFKKIKKGTYLDIGACHPRWTSNTHLLHKNGFKGFCVDLDERKLRWFRFARGNRVKTICGAVTNEHNKFIEVYKVRSRSPFSLIDTVSLDHVKRKEKKGYKYEKKTMRNYHINDIFSLVGKINVLNIDIEGKDFEALKSSKLDIIDPEVILIEDHNSYFPSKELIKFFSDKEYFLISICGLTKCFAKK